MASIAMTETIDAEIRQEQFTLIKRKLSALLEIFIDNFQSQPRCSQERLFGEIIDLESYINGLCSRFPAEGDCGIDSTRNLDAEIEWIDIKACAILAELEKGRQGLKVGGR